MRSLPISCCFALFFACAAFAQIQYDESRKVWLITSSHSSYAMGIGPTGQLQHLYWGGPLWHIADVPGAQESRDISSFDPHQMLENEEFPGWGGPRYYEPALKITRADGNRDLVLHYESQHVDGDDLAITLKDIRDDIEATLHYHVYPETGIIARSAVIRNRSQQPL